MTRGTVYVMLILVCLAAGAALWMGRETGDKSNADPLRLVDWSTVEQVACERLNGTRWEMRREGERWMLSSPSVAEGRSVAANDEIRLHIFGVLQDTVPLQSVATQDLDLAEWGIAPPDLRLTLKDAGGSWTIDFGKADVNQEVYYRIADGGTCFKTDRSTLEELWREPRWLRDPHLCDVPLHRVTYLRFRPRNREGFDLEKVGLKWMVRRGDEPARRGDYVLCEQVVNGLSGMRGDPPPPDAVPEIPSGKPAYRVEVRDQDGSEHAFSVLLVDDENHRIVAKRDDEPDVRFVPGSFRRFLDYEAKDLEDPVFIGFDARDLSSIELKGPGRPGVLHLKKTGGRWLLAIGPEFLWAVDVDAFRKLRDALLGMRVESRLAEVADFEPDVTAVFQLSENTQAPPVYVEFSKPDAEGRRFARRSDEDGGVLLPRIANHVLETPYWALLSRHVAAGLDASIDKIAIRDREGVERTVVRTGEKSWRLESVTREGRPIADPKGREVAAEFLQGLLVKLTYFQVLEFAGPPDAATKASFEKPLYVVRWHHPEAKRRIPADSPWVQDLKVVEIGRRIDDTRYACRINTFPNLIFYISGEDLNRIEDALRGMK
ncbi:MAG TPA: DUF4340 domain-containing protein [Planctomycetes bacterium]|nr:DUF4340 domain-containing protein [Planctomycetota bacterium]